VGRGVGRVLLSLKVDVYSVNAMSEEPDLEPDLGPPDLEASEVPHRGIVWFIGQAPRAVEELNDGVRVGDVWHQH
jgi:hypothetical protein